MTSQALFTAAAFGLAAVMPIAALARAEDRQAPGAHVVVIEAMAFTPSTLEIRAGESVTFKNTDLVPHTATAKKKPPAGFDSGTLKPGESWTVTPGGTEPVQYACSFHPMMKGVINVTDSAPSNTSRSDHTPDFGRQAASGKHLD